MKKKRKKMDSRISVKVPTKTKNREINNRKAPEKDIDKRKLKKSGNKAILLFPVLQKNPHNIEKEKDIALQCWS